MTALEIQKKIAPLLPRGTQSLEDFFKEALLYRLQETSKKIAVFEGKYNKGFGAFERDWPKLKRTKQFSYDVESDYLDWEALESYKRNLMQVMHSL